MYVEKFDKVIVREAGKINYKLYYDKGHDQFYILIKIPSEVVPKFYYDVVIQFYTDDNGIRTDATLQDYNVKFFSNDPAFVFTYLRVFRKNDMFVEALKEKSPKLALNKDPKEKNPFEIPGYVKSIYFAYLYMKAHNLFLKSNYTMYGDKYDKSILVRQVEEADSKIAKRQSEGERVAKEKAKQKSDDTKKSRDAYLSSIDDFNNRNKQSDEFKVGRIKSSVDKNAHIIKPKKFTIGQPSSSVHIIGKKKK